MLDIAMAGNSVQHWVDKLQLAAHPNAKGYYKETFKDSVQVKNDEGKDRSASTLIYFLHVTEQLDNSTTFFRIQTTEMVHWYQGEPITLYYMPDKNTTELEKVVLGPEHDQFHFCFPRQRWISRLCLTDKKDGFSLVGATFAPGLDFQDMETRTFGELKESCL